MGEPGEVAEPQPGLRKKGSVHSLASKASKRSASSGKSKSTFGSKLSSFTKGSFFSRSTTSGVSKDSDTPDVCVGEHCETISPTTMRAEEDISSPVITELPIGVSLEVIALGMGRRIKVRHQVGSSQPLDGWISAKTSLNEPLVMKRKYDAEYGTDIFEVGGQHEVKSIIMLRRDEPLDSDPVGELKPGAIIRIIELGKLNQRRVKVSSDNQEGWISTVTKVGELLIGKVGEVNGANGGLFTTNSAKTKQLLDASRVGDLATVKKLAEGGGMMSRLGGKANLNSSDIRGKTALIYAASCGHLEIVEYLLSRGPQVDVNILDDTQKGALHHAAKRMPMGDAASAMQAEIVAALIQNGAYLEARDHNGCTALIFAVANGDANVVQKLVDVQADVNVRDFEGHTPLDYARNFEHDEVERMLRAAGAEATGVHSEDEEDDGDIFDPPGEATGAASPTASGSPAGAAAAATASGTATASGASPKAASKKAAAGGASSKAAGKKKAKAAAKKKAGPKAKAGAKKAGDKNKIEAKMMLEILDDGESGEAQEVTVQEAAKEEEDDKTRCLRKLQVVVETVTSPKEVEAVIQQAEAAGASDEELRAPREKLADLKARMGMREALMEAMQDKDVKRLKEFIPQAEQNKIPKADLEKAKKVLKAEEPRQDARDKLLAAHERGSPADLKVAIAAAKKAGVPAEELKEYEDLLAGAESKDKAEKALQDAMESLDVGALRLAIDLAKGAGVDKSSIQKAEAILADEEPRAKAREQVWAATEANTTEKLKAALAVAKAAGLDASEIKEIEDAIQRKADAEKFMKQVDEALKASESCDMKDVESVREAKERLADAIQGALSKGVPETDLLDAELRRKKLHNTIEDLKGSIRVFCRIRPLNKREKDLKDHEITKRVDPMTLSVGEHGEHVFFFDAVFHPGTQEEIFEDCKDLVQSAVDGYNVTLFAYGQTGAGKTFTMAGVPGMLGVSPRTISEIYSVIEKGKSRFQYTVMGSMLELYRQDLVDLLAKGNPAAEKAKLQVRVEKSGMVTVEHLISEQCDDAASLERLLERGTKARAVAATAMNSESSRSHLVLMIHIVSVNRETKEQLRGKILIVDLAGSERLKKSQTTADMQKESIEINKSLTALGDVIEALTKGSKVIPYRNHKLTQLMQDALGGTAKTLMFVNCSPASNNEDETVMSLKYAARAKKITNKR